MLTKTATYGLAIVLAATTLGAAQAHAQQNCGPREAVIERLKGGFGEGLAAGGLRSEAQVLEVWAAPETGTWTVLMTRADGISCVMASGTNWHQQDPGFVLMGVPG
ncbi:MAG: hypothetical protein QNJ16_15990 [Rhodobacter sp.]|nr:hypothetical protein [Rhodobacter sp.]